MKVGMIGLGRMGEGMSRRLIAAGHEVHGFRNNYAKAQEQFEKGYISGCTTSVESLVQVVHQNKTTGETPGVFMMVVPAETVEDTLNELLQFCVEEILLLIMAIAILRTLAAGRKGYLNLASNILTAALVVVFTVWSVDIVLWLVVQILQYPLAVHSLMHSHQASRLPLEPMTEVMFGILKSGDGCIAELQALVTFVKMVHNGIEYGIMQAYAEGFQHFT